MSTTGKGVVVYTHQGMGDQIECNGLVRDICEHGVRFAPLRVLSDRIGIEYDYVDLIAKELYVEGVEFMYRDVPNIRKIHVIPDEFSWDYTLEFAWVIKMAQAQGIDLCQVGHKEYFDNLSYFTKRQQTTGQVFYALMGLPWSDRIDKFHIERDYEQEQRVFEKLNPNNEKYIF